jgi:hypothetical protein
MARRFSFNSENFCHRPPKKQDGTEEKNNHEERRKCFVYAWFLALKAGFTANKTSAPYNNKSIHITLCYCYDNRCFMGIIMLGFSAQMIECRLGSDHQLVKIYHLLDWDRFAVLLYDVYKRKESVAPSVRVVAGVKPYDPVKMFRAIILQTWHSLSDPKVEALQYFQSLVAISAESSIYCKVWYNKTLHHIYFIICKRTKMRLPLGL